MLRETCKTVDSAGRCVQAVRRIGCVAVSSCAGQANRLPRELLLLFYMATRRKVDGLNLAAGLDDILVERGILADDNSRIVAGHDGTRVLYDPKNPRTEIYITEMEENT